MVNNLECMVSMRKLWLSLIKVLWERWEGKGEASFGVECIDKRVERI